jgi:hypothetical protein
VFVLFICRAKNCGIFGRAVVDLVYNCGISSLTVSHFFLAGFSPELKADLLWIFDFDAAFSAQKVINSL